MTQDIIRMAREAGFKIDGDSWIHAGVVLVDGRKSIDEQLKRFANLAAAAELRQLHESNKDLLEALKDMGARYGLTDVAREAIANAEGENT